MFYFTVSCDSVLLRNELMVACAQDVARCHSFGRTAVGRRGGANGHLRCQEVEESPDILIYLTVSNRQYEHG